MPPDATICPAHDFLVEKIDAVATKLDKLAEQQQETALLVARIAGHLGLNGAAGQPHPHKRDEEPEPHLHRRTDDKASWLRRNWQTLLLIVFAALAGERALTETAKMIRELVK